MTAIKHPDVVALVQEHTGTLKGVAAELVLFQRLHRDEGGDGEASLTQTTREEGRARLDDVEMKLKDALVDAGGRSEDVRDLLGLSRVFARVPWTDAQRREREDAERTRRLQRTAHEQGLPTPPVDPVEHHFNRAEPLPAFAATCWQVCVDDTIEWMLRGRAASHPLRQISSLRARHRLAQSELLSMANARGDVVAAADELRECQARLEAACIRYILDRGIDG